MPQHESTPGAPARHETIRLDGSDNENMDEVVAEQVRQACQNILEQYVALQRHIRQQSEPGSEEPPG